MGWVSGLLKGDPHLDSRSAQVFASPAMCMILYRSSCSCNPQRTRRCLPALVVVSDGLLSLNSGTRFLWSVQTKAGSSPALIQCTYRGKTSPIGYASLSMMAHRVCAPRNRPDTKANGRCACSWTGRCFSSGGIWVITSPQKSSLASVKTHVSCFRSKNAVTTALIIDSRIAL